MDGAMEAVGLGRGGERARPAAVDAPRRPRAGRQGQGRGVAAGGGLRPATVRRRCEAVTARVHSSGAGQGVGAALVFSRRSDSAIRSLRLPSPCWRTGPCRQIYRPVRSSK